MIRIIIISLLVYTIMLIILPIRLLYDLFNWRRHKLYLDEGPMDAIRLTFNPIIEIFRCRGITFMDSFGYISKEIEGPGKYTRLFNGFIAGSLHVDNDAYINW